MSDSRHFERRLREALRDESVQPRIALRVELLQLMESLPAEGWIYDQLSHLEQSLKNYGQAHHWINLKCERCGQTTKRDRKRLGVLAQHLRDQKTIPMPDEHVHDMLADFSSMEWDSPQVHESTTRTENWLEENVYSLAIQEAVLEHFQDLELNSDFEIYHRLRKTLSPENK